MSPTPAGVVGDLLRNLRLPIGDEASLQRAIEGLLGASGVIYHREHRLEQAGTIDFYLPGSAEGIEVKVMGSPAEVRRQLQRYARCPQIARLILVTGRARLAAQPAILGGKPLHVVTLWEELI